MVNAEVKLIATSPLKMRASGGRNRRRMPVVTVGGVGIVAYKGHRTLGFEDWTSVEVVADGCVTGRETLTEVSTSVRVEVIPDVALKSRTTFRRSPGASVERKRALG